ncbi:MAG TPA: hypothetical protein VMU66_05535, partial [Gaiellales bacterium]|nr:hypothetical protein [Gaiellales bacterium]
VTRRGWPRPVAAAVPAFRRRLRRGVGGAGRGIPLRTAPGDRTTLAAGVCMTAGFAAEAAGRYRVGGGSAEPVGLALVGLAAGLLGVIAALSRHRRRVAPAAAAAGLAGGILGLVARGAYVAGWHGMIPLDALSDLMIAWWLWSVAVAARRPPVSTGAGVAAVGLMLAVVPLTPSGAGDLAWTFAMALTASAGVCLLAVALIGRPVLRLPRAGLRIAHAVTSLRLSGRRSAVVATVAAALVSVGVFSIPPPAAGGTRIATCVPRVVHVRTALAATRATVHGRVTLSAARACRPRGRVVVRVRLTAAGGRRLAPSLAGLSPRVTWIGVIGPGGSATVFSRARTDWCRRARFPAVVTLTVSIRGGRSGSSGAAVCGHAAAGTST